ncbi:hypothetical protein Dsin_009764 [Dipteronia sinensis]|uniref:Reverse transcriptase zinc-binding domain-containing protein n=1 Tax=Dipteronia sinensis TaxID=43782 RepID=A0AAE0ASE6_9ROSI|nr:hypothetical protein Dsin_009764 [Dipteronia sinensis]
MRDKGSQFFKAVSRILAEGHRAHVIFKKSFQVVCRNGGRIKLWKEIVWDSIPLKLAFLRIFTLSSNKEGVVNEYGRWDGSKWIWDANLRRLLFGWDTYQWNCFLLSLDSIPIRKNFPDALAWSHCPNGLFSVSSFKRCLDEGNVAEISSSTFLWQGICRSKVEIFSSQLLKDRTLGNQANLGMASDSIKLRVVWWFKNHGYGSKKDLTLLLLNINERCVDNSSGRPVSSSIWSPPIDNVLFFNVDGSARGNPEEAGH